MLSITQAIEKAREMRQENSNALKDVDVVGSIESEILGLHESATRLWIATMGKKGQEEINRRTASALIGVMILADRLGVNNLESEFLKRITEVVEANNK